MPQAVEAGPWRLALAASLPLLLGAGWWVNVQRQAVGSVVETGKRLSNAEVVESGSGVLTLALAARGEGEAAGADHGGAA